MTTGGGLFIVNQYLPLGIHSIGIMAISIAMGFLAYSLYLKRFDK
jgi:TctA family transporter